MTWEEIRDLRRLSGDFEYAVRILDRTAHRYAWKDLVETNAIHWAAKKIKEVSNRGCRVTAQLEAYKRRNTKLSKQLREERAK